MATTVYHSEVSAETINLPSIDKLLSDFSDYATNNAQINDEDIPEEEKIRHFATKYVLLRTTFLPDIGYMENIWEKGGILEKMSSTQVYRDFWKYTGKKIMLKLKQDGLTSYTEILTINPIKDENWDNLWQAEYKSDYYVPSSNKPLTIKYKATMQIVHWKDSYKVVNYGVKRIDK